MTRTTYADARDDGHGFYKVTFRDNTSDNVLLRSFDSEYFCREFIRKLKHSKRCTLLSYPMFYA